MEADELSSALKEAVEERKQELRRSARLNNRRRRRASRISDFQHRIDEIWSEVFVTYEEAVATCAELGDTVAELAGSDSKLFYVMNLLRNRSVQVAWEVRALAGAGFADGAYARWRTLHELAVVSEFLKQNGEDVAVRYLDHAAIKSRKIIRECNECCGRLRYQPIPQSKIDEAEERKNELLEKYGNNFKNEWGWAAEACGKANPTFFDLRKHVDYPHWKAHFGMANHAVHAGPHGVLFRLGHPLGSRPSALSGPSLVGLGTPLDAATITLMHATFSFSTCFPARGEAESLEAGVETLALMKLITTFADDIQEQVVIASASIEEQFGVDKSEEGA